MIFQASALQFNAQHNVDFNTWIKDGIPYMSREDRINLVDLSPIKLGCVNGFLWMILSKEKSNDG